MKFKSALSAVLFAASAPSAFALAGESSPEPTRHVMNFDDVELSALIADVSTVTGYTFIVHPDARTKRVTVSSSTPLTRDQVFDVFLSALRVHGFTAVPAGRSTYRIVPERQAVSDASVSSADSNTFTTEIFALKHSSARDVAAVIKPLIAEQGQVVANNASNTLVVVDYASNLPRLRAMLKQIDTDPSVTQTISLKNIPAREMASILTALSVQPGENAAAINFQAVSSESGNAVVLQGDEALVRRAVEVSRELDSHDRTEDSLRVIPLNNATAVDLVPVLQQMAVAMDARRAAGGELEASTTIAQHEPTNSLVISAPPETLGALERIITDLDRRRAQVLVEAIIVEMSDDTARELGLQFLVSGSNDSTVPFVSTNYSRSAPSMLALAGALSSDTPFNTGDTETNPFAEAAINSLLGLSGLSVGVGGQDGDTLFGAILTAVENDTQSRILSKPFNMTLDNGTSSLLVGQEVPVATGEVLGDSNSNPFRTVERRDVGVGLNVTPRISNDDTIRLDIIQEVSNIAQAITTGSSTDLIFNTRKIETSVIADDGEIIVLGGLVEQTESMTNEKVPVLGDIPVAGRLFRSEGKGLARTNLMVFIRPTIVRNRTDARNATTRSYRYLRAQELWDGQENSAESLDRFVNQVLGSPPPQ
ncbi:type II secretion system secretin GspD [Hyphomonas sp.]|uniref:type II secretion system secretin GspD n=1 Tax=Hyphomonas sp. TaxID=87 RepID=UPI000C68BD52|nr:type II secretion system secretin GspD [Hyphomonas sp.]MAU67063.1 type II secretion system protein GspD [Hyphomonas sp.]MBM57191.1 type II secretion system protein GspD [Hyphomonas sp.]